MTSSFWNLPPVRTGSPASPTLAAGRAQLVDAEPSQSPVGDVVVRSEDHAGVMCLTCEPAAATPTILYFHGGGYRMGTPGFWLGWASRLAAATGARVVCPDYRLAPEHPFPAALHDAASVYELLQRNDERGANIVLCGDSAGGGLALALALACRATPLEMPRGLVLLSPWVDLTVTASTYESRATTDQLFSAVAAREAAETYLQGIGATEPLASPLRSDLANLPPVLVFAGGDEVLLDDAVSLAARLAAAGGTVEAHFVAGMQHVWPTLYPELDASAAALDAIARFVTRSAAGPRPSSAVGGR